MAERARLREKAERAEVGVEGGKTSDLASHHSHPITK